MNTVLPPSGTMPTAGVVVHAALEPEEVLEHVQGGEPAVRVVHELNAALDHRGALARGNGVDDLKDGRVRLILGVEDGDHLARGHRRTDVQAVRFVDWRVVEGEQAHVLDALPPQRGELLVRPGRSCRGRRPR